MSRLISEIAWEISKDWKNMYCGAQPYVEAMKQISKITDRFYADTARDIVVRFLCNAGTWRGETARRVKAELKKMLQ